MSVVLRTLDCRAAVVVPTKPKISSLDGVNVIYEDFRLQSSACHTIKSLTLRVQLSHIKQHRINTITYTLSGEKSLP